MQTTTFQVNGMSCMGCVNVVKRVLSSLAGVHAVEADLASGRVQVDHDAQCVPEALREAIESAGYKVVSTN